MNPNLPESGSEFESPEDDPNLRLFPSCLDDSALRHKGKVCLHQAISHCQSGSDKATFKNYIDNERLGTHGFIGLALAVNEDELDIAFEIEAFDFFYNQLLDAIQPILLDASRINYPPIKLVYDLLNEVKTGIKNRDESVRDLKLKKPR